MSAAIGIVASVNGIIPVAREIISIATGIVIAAKGIILFVIGIILPAKELISFAMILKIRRVGKGRFLRLIKAVMLF